MHTEAHTPGNHDCGPLLPMTGKKRKGDLLSPVKLWLLKAKILISKFSSQRRVESDRNGRVEKGN